MIRHLPRLRPAKECTTCDICGNPLTIPPGVVYRGRKMHKTEADMQRRDDLSREVIGPQRNDTERSIKGTLLEDS